MRFLILGAGALGGFFGSRLINGGADVTFLVRPGRAAQLQRHGLIVNGQDGDVFRKAVRIVQPGQIDGPYDIVLLSCKAYDLASAMDAIAPAIGEQSAVLPVLNGIRHIDMLTERFGAERVIGGLSLINAALLADGTVQQGSMRVNTTTIGELDGRMTPRCEAIRTAMTAGGLKVNVTDDIAAALWSKFFLIACGATISSLTRSRVSAIARSPIAPAFIANVIDECTRVATAEGYPPPPEPVGILRQLYSQPGSSYGPSILVDMEDGRTTEGEHIIGDMVRRATQRGVSAPILTAALCNLQAYEINRAQRQANPKS